MNGPQAAYLDGNSNGRLHLQHGPIDLVIGVDGGRADSEADNRALAFALAERRFRTILTELVDELPLLKSQARSGNPQPEGSVARRMVAAVLPFAAGHFITPMAAVAGSVADEIRDAILAGFDTSDRPSRIYVNNGGDIALHLDHPSEFRIGIAREDGAALGQFALSATETARGIATSGRGGRSLSMGIADSVTIVARSAAAADAAATIIANAVDLPGHPLVTRRKASDVADDSDLGERLVVTGCGALSAPDIKAALDAGERMADTLIARGLIHRAALFLKGQGRVVLPSPTHSASSPHLEKHHA